MFSFNLLSKTKNLMDKFILKWSRTLENWYFFIASVELQRRGFLRWNSLPVHLFRLPYDDWQKQKQRIWEWQQRWSLQDAFSYWLRPHSTVLFKYVCVTQKSLPWVISMRFTMTVDLRMKNECRWGKWREILRQVGFNEFEVRTSKI